MEEKEEQEQEDEEKEEDEEQEGLCDQGALPAGSGMTNGELSRLSIVCPDAPTYTQTLAHRTLTYTENCTCTNAV